MAIDVLTEEHIQILRRNGIDLADYGVVHTYDRYIVFLNRHTHHEVTINRAQCEWLPKTDVT